MPLSIGTVRSAATKSICSHILRHKAFAHLASISYNDVFKLAAVRPDQLRELTKLALKIANCLLLARGLKDECFTTLPREDAEKMMKALAATMPKPRQ